MNTQSRTKLVVWLVIGVLILAAAAGAFWFFMHYTMLDFHVYPTDQAVLDLRSETLSTDNFRLLRRRMPDTKIIWSVPIADGIDSDVTEVEVTALSEKDLPLFEYLTDLQTIHGENCTDYPQLLKLQSSYPDCKVLYKVNIGGKVFDQGTDTIVTSTMTAEDVPLLAFLPQLSHIEATGCSDYPMLEKLQQEHPEWNVEYTVPMGDTLLEVDTVDAVVRNADCDSIVKGLPGLHQLKSLTVEEPAATGAELVQLRQEYPELDIHWQMTIHDNVYTDDIEELDISDKPLQSIDEAKAYGSCFPNLTKLIVDSGSIENEDMAAYRNEVREQYKVVWTVTIGTEKCGYAKIRTDTTNIVLWKIGMRFVHDHDTPNFVYCEDMIAFDAGHSSLSDVSFLRGMPHMKYLILNLSNVSDISPLSSCKEMVFLELCDAPVKDYSPLLECTALEDLNLGGTMADHTPIRQMTWLKNLWWYKRSANVKVDLEQYLPNTNLMFAPQMTSGMTNGGWRDLPNYFAMRDALGMYYMK